MTTCFRPAFLACTLALSGTALADTVPRAYLGFGLGKVSYGYDSEQCTNDIAYSIGAPCTVDGKDRGIKIFGGVQASPYLGLEASYHDFGSLNGDVPAAGVTVKERQRALSGSVLGSLPLGERAAVFAKVGYFSVSLDATASGPGGTAELSDSATDFLVGAGLRLMVNTHFGLRLEVERYNGAGDSSTDIDTTTAGVLLQF